jgi:hypothetical protein
VKWIGAGLALTCAIAAATAVAAPGEDAPYRGGFAERLLIAHNAERDRSGVPRLKWSGQLAAQAQAWAATLARSNRFEHAADRSGAGENLWMGTAGRFSPEDMIDGFVSERRHFRPGRFPDVSKTGNWLDIGHYTQLIWPATQEVGCAVSRGADSDILVCRYYPAGNTIGERVG